MTDFYLASTELREPFAPRRCKVLRRIKSELRDDLALVEIIPPLPAVTYDTDQDIDSLILGSRLEGLSIFPVSRWPLPVYICKSKTSSDSSGFIRASDLTVLDKGEIRIVASEDQ